MIIMNWYFSIHSVWPIRDDGFSFLKIMQFKDIRDTLKQEGNGPIDECAAIIVDQF